MANESAPQRGQFQTLEQLLRTLLYTRLQMHRRGIDPRLNRMLTPDDTREAVWAEAVAAEILGIIILGGAPGPDGSPTGVTLAQAGGLLQHAAAESNALRERFLQLEPTLADIPPGKGALVKLLNEYLKRRGEAGSCFRTP